MGYFAKTLCDAYFDKMFFGWQYNIDENRILPTSAQMILVLLGLALSIEASHHLRLSRVWRCSTNNTTYSRKTKVKFSRRNFLTLVASLLLTGTAFVAHAADAPRVSLKTNMGEIVLELNPGKAPKTVENFLQYVKSGQYNGTIFHRVIENFMIQGGGLEPDLKERPTKATIENEARNGLKNEPYTLAMARRGDPHSASAQFFINTKNNESLDYPGSDGWGYCVFGKVVKGMDVVDKIKKVPVADRGMNQAVPIKPVVIESASLTK